MTAKIVLIANSTTMLAETLLNLKFKLSEDGSVDGPLSTNELNDIDSPK